MAKRPSIQDLSRLPLIVGTTCFTDPSGMQGYKTEQIQASALVRIADALENRPHLATTTLQIRPTYADEFRDLVAELVADLREQVEIRAWHLMDEHTLEVTLAYKQAESLWLLGRHWESIRAEEFSNTLLRARNDVHDNLAGYCTSLAWLTMLGEVEQGVPLEADQAWEQLVFLQRKVRELDTLHHLLNQQLAEQEGSQGHA